MSRVATALGLYALAVAVVLWLLASLFVAPIVVWGRLAPVTIYGSLTLLGLWLFLVIFEPLEDTGPEARPALAKLFVLPLALSAVATGAAVLVTQFEPAVRTVVDGASLTVLQAGAAFLVLAAVVLFGLPFAVHRIAWDRVEEVTGPERSTIDGSREGTTAPPAVGDQFAAVVPDRLAVRWVDESTPAVYVFDDGRRAVLAFTDGALDALSAREREAVAARELTRVLERATVPSFWTSALALGVANVLDPVATEPYDSRAGGTVRLPFWFVAPLKLIAGVVALGLLFLWPIWLLSELLPVSGLTLVAAYAVGTVLAGFTLAKATSRVARRVATAGVHAADERGAVLADDPDALASALRTLHDAGGVDRADDVLGPLRTLADCPTDRVQLEDRLDALDAVGEKLTARPGDSAAGSSGDDRGQPGE